MNVNQLQFSFVKAFDGDYSFTIYRQPHASYETKLDGTYRYYLPLNSTNTELKDNYLVCFYEREGFNEFECKASYNTGLTNKWLIEMLKKKTNEVLRDDNYFVGKRFIPNIEYVIKSYPEGNQTVVLEPYYFAKKNEFGFTIDFKFRPFIGFKGTAIEKILSLSISKDNQKNKNMYLDKYKFIQKFLSDIAPKVFPIGIRQDVNISINLSTVDFFSLDEKKYCFKNGTGTTQFQGIKDFMPLYTPVKPPLFVFIFEKSKVNTSRELLKALRGEAYPTFTGMKKMFGVNFDNDNIKSIQTDDYSLESINSVNYSLDNIIQQYPNHEIVGIFAGISRDFDRDDKYSPYYTIKNMFLKKGLAVQAVTIEQSLKREGFKWSVAGIALQIFVKLGGQPWKVVPRNDNCLIFGIGCSHVFDDSGNIRRYFAYSVCLDSSGLYKRLELLSNGTDEKTYIETLSEKIKEQLENVVRDGVKKCAIHVPFKLKKSEMQCIKESVMSVQNQLTDIEFVFIKINTDNRFFGYSDANSKIPLISSYIELDKYEYLVWFEGLQKGTQTVNASNVTKPVHIKFMDVEKMDDNTVKNYLQDVINLSGANWRGFNAKHTPISIYYPELIAGFIGKFDLYDLPFEIGESASDKVWFV